MENADEFYVVMVTAPELSVARTIVRDVLERKLAACGNIFPGVESHYWWQGKIEQAAEVLVLFKTAKKALPRLLGRIAEIHPYDTPEIIALEIARGGKKYLDWIASSVGQAAESSR